MNSFFGKILHQAMRLVFKNFKLVFLLWGLNFLFAFVLTVPLYILLANNIGHSVVSEDLMLGFDYVWYIQFRNIYQTSLDNMPLLLYSIVGIYVLIQTFFLGGLIAVFNYPKKNHIVDFFYGGVTYWLRFMKIVLVALIFFALAFLINDLLGDAISWLFFRNENLWADFILRSLRYIILLFLIGVVTMISDYAKVYMAIEDEHKLIPAINATLIFIKQNFNIVFSIFLFVAVIGAAGSVIYNLMGSKIPRVPFYFLIISFVLQQMLIIFRLLVRMLFTSSEVLVYKDLSADIVSAEVQEQRVGV